MPPAQEKVHDVDVAVIGCGPVGALTANLLGARGVRTLVVERHASPHGRPRALSCDDEALRIYQQAGLVEQVSRDTHTVPVAEYVNRAGRAVATVALAEVDFGLGHPPLGFVDQRPLEQTLRAGLGRFGHVDLRLGVELVALRQDAEGVTLVLRDVITLESRMVRARYVLGCDGARSTTRAATGIGVVGSSYAEPWLEISGDVAPDGIRVERTTFVCDWRRPAFASPGAKGSYRMAFMLRPGETADEMRRPETIGALVEPYVDPSRFAVTGAVVSTYHHFVARQWRVGRVFLLGDAAHRIPPFLGQGLCGGLRDAANLSWKVALVLAGAADPTLLDTYEIERRPHATAMARTSARLGRVFLVRSRSAAWLRDSALRVLQTVPRIRRFVRHFEFKPLPAYPTGLMAGGRCDGGVGTMFPQPRVATAARPAPHLLDEALGAGFAVLGFGGAAEPSRGEWREPAVRFAVVHRAGTAPEGLPPLRGDGGAERVDLVDVDGTISAWLRRHRVEAVVLRPDRFVYGVVPAGGTGRAGHALATALGTPQSAPGPPVARRSGT
ncbi:bifunctional 3-(3-hydroxy-phenyl)propionate/3-hydroxycinnamic acid hydroxylase [Micromonospora rubida]|uniref:bifunctional 3-(3-hydroxy-phenyl)propionate/3-hydroxycinnamic acid hydroxylase n=1 Tax=Micromonospora rubida TaxID=2697657 RepID=UPI0013765094|nr:bifunctional 3-(3-hydroxy-phenyl)propionate/3-hydroxycinnamic acid hydroxylase [Micromonospora rubida]NBE83377.1 bifunctional 3-(3-hydroxy-phenyl)propionate/3-hydroxycinnamic acid hydroxylase [Micromonospora rubida]